MTDTEQLFTVVVYSEKFEKSAQESVCALAPRAKTLNLRDYVRWHDSSPQRVEAVARLLKFKNAPAHTNHTETIMTHALDSELYKTPSADYRLVCGIPVPLLRAFTSRILHYCAKNSLFLRIVTLAESEKVDYEEELDSLMEDVYPLKCCITRDFSVTNNGLINCGDSFRPRFDSRKWDCLDDTTVWANSSVALAVLEQMKVLSESSKNAFVGAHCVSLDSARIRSFLTRFKYVFSKKVDGTRYLMLVQNNGLFFINRKMDVQSLIPEHCRLHFASFSGSLLDVEVYRQSIVILDCIAFQNKTIRAAVLSDRLAVVAASRFSEIMNESLPFCFLLQDYMPLSRLHDPDIHDGLFLPSGGVKYGGDPVPPIYDGLVFTPSQKGYRLGRDESLFKWKRPEDNTADFFLRPGSVGDKRNYVYSYEDTTEGGESRLVCMGFLVGSGIPTSLSQSTIVEATYIDEGIWRFVKVRHDKNNCNTVSVVRNIVSNIKQSLSLADIKSFVAK